MRANQSVLIGSRKTSQSRANPIFTKPKSKQRSNSYQKLKNMMNTSRNSDKSSMRKQTSTSRSKSKSKRKLFQKLRKGGTRDSMERTTFPGKSQNDIHVHFNNKQQLREYSLDEINKSISPVSLKKKKGLRKQKSKDAKRTPIRILKVPHVDSVQPSYCEYVIDYVQNQDQDEDPSQTQKSLSNRSNSSRKMSYNLPFKNQPESFANSGVQFSNTKKQKQQEVFFEKEFKDTQKELLNAKAKIYEQRYKIECLKKRLIDTDKQKNDYQQKFMIEQEKSDEYFIKSEKNKQAMKDYKNEIDSLTKQLEEAIKQKEDDLRYYENALKQMEEKEKQVTQEHNTLIRELLTSMNQIQKYQAQTQNNQIFHRPMNKIYDVLRKINELMLNQSIHTQSYRSQNSGYQEDQRSAHRVPKITKDQIFVNGESLQVKDDYCLQQKSTENTNREQAKYKQFRENKSHQSSFQSNLISDSNREISVNKHNQSIQQEFLQSIQREMQKMKEDSQKVLEENHRLAQQNIELNNILIMEKQKVEQSLIPQYREAFDQMRVANEMMQKKIEDLEREKNGQSQTFSPTQQFQEELNLMKERMLAFENENKNLRDEKDSLQGQISNLNSYNRNQEQLIQQFQSTYQQMLQNMTLNQNQSTQKDEISKTQPVIKKTSFDSVCNFSNYSGNKENQDFKAFLQSRKEINHQNQLEELIQKRNNRGHQNLSYDNLRNIQVFQQELSKINETNSNSYLSNRSSQIISQDFQIPTQSVKVLDYQQQSSRRPSTKKNEGSARENCTLEKYKSYDNDHLFSLSSTQPDQFRISPIKICAPRQLDFNKSSNEQRVSHYEEMEQKDPLIVSKQYCHQSTSQFGQNSDSMYPQDIIEEQKSEDESLNYKHNSHSQRSFPVNMSAQRMSQESYESGPAKAYQYSPNKSDISQKIRNRSGSQKRMRNEKQYQDKVVNQETFSAQDQHYPQHSCKNGHRKKSGRSSGGQTLILITTENKSHGSPQVEEILSNYLGSQQSDLKSPTFKEGEVFDGIHQFGIDISNRGKVGNRSSPFIKTNQRQSFDPNAGTQVQSTKSQFMSERTMNLKKEITSLDDEILLLQHSLKQALLKKQNNEEN